MMDVNVFFKLMLVKYEYIHNIIYLYTKYYSKVCYNNMCFHLFYPIYWSHQTVQSKY